MADIIGKGKKHREDSHRTGSNTLTSSDQEIKSSLSKETRKTLPEREDDKHYVRDILQFNQGFVPDEL